MCYDCILWCVICNSRFLLIVKLLFSSLLFLPPSLSYSSPHPLPLSPIPHHTPSLSLLFLTTPPPSLSYSSPHPLPLSPIPHHTPSLSLLFLTTPPPSLSYSSPHPLSLLFLTTLPPSLLMHRTSSSVWRTLSLCRVSSCSL